MPTKTECCCTHSSAAREEGGENWFNCEYVTLSRQTSSTRIAKHRSFIKLKFLQNFCSSCTTLADQVARNPRFYCIPKHARNVVVTPVKCGLPWLLTLPAGHDHFKVRMFLDKQLPRSWIHDFKILQHWTYHLFRGLTLNLVVHIFIYNIYNIYI
jgi:hypothetical protein